MCSAVTICTCPKVTWLEGSHDLMSCRVTFPDIVQGAGEAGAGKAGVEEGRSREGSTTAGAAQETQSESLISVLLCGLYTNPPSLSLSCVATHQLLQSDWRWQTNRLLPVLPRLKNASYCIMVSLSAVVSLTSSESTSVYLHKDVSQLVFIFSPLSPCQEWSVQAVVGAQLWTNQSTQRLVYVAPFPVPHCSLCQLQYESVSSQNLWWRTGDEASFLSPLPMQWCKCYQTRYMLVCMTYC